MPALIGTLTVPLMAFAGHLLGGRLVALAASFLLAVSPLHVYFSREGRPYYLLMALALALLCALLQKGSRVGRTTAWVACLLGAYVGLHALPVLATFLALATFAWLLSRQPSVPLSRSPYLHYLAAASIALALSYGLYMTRSKMNMPAIEQGESQSALQESPVFESPLSERSRQRFLASMTTSGHPSVLMRPRSWLLIALAGVGLLAIGSVKDGSVPTSRDRLLVAGMFFLPAVLSIVALVAVGRWYGIRYTSSAHPAFLLLVALGISSIASLVSRATARAAMRSKRLARPLPRWTTTAIVAALLLAVVAPNIEAASNDPYRKLDWRGVAEFFDQIALPGEPIVIPNDWPKICLDYYLQQQGRQVEFISIWETAARGDAVVAERPMGWLLTAGYRKSNEARAWMHQFVPVMKRSEEEMALFFFPDLVTLLQTRYQAQKGSVFDRQFDEMGRRFEFGGGETTLQGLGWSYPENDGAGMDFQWAVGEQAELGVPVGTAEDALIRLRAQPFTYPEASPQEVDLYLNDTTIATFQLPEGWSEHEIEVPASTWSSGANILYLRFRRTTRVSEAIEGASDRRSLSAAFDYLEVVPQ
jgi:hypothetical protein